VLTILEDIKLGDPPALAARLDLAEALRNGWIEFWYQPKIDLRKKQLVGIEAFTRARHPQNGVLMPSAFMPGAKESDLIALSEQALAQGLKANVNFAKLGVNLRLAVNIPVNALVEIAVTDIVQTYRPQFETWPGLIIEVMEEEIVTELALANDIAKKLEAIDVQLAIDDCGPGSCALEGLKQLPFAEIKLDGAFVADCGTDKVNAPLCKTVIDLAHSFGRSAVGTGIEKASDALALVSMGCDCGQGFLLGRPMLEERFIALLSQRAASQTRQLSADRAVPARA
jgi:EAL domain-containing protein (putative c-di-GMP-specific phosphodiesterase class I)